MRGRIYLIRNLINGKGYVGQTSYSLGHRWSRHKFDAKRGMPSLLHRAMRKYGNENFIIEQVVLGEDYLLNDLEIHYIKFYGTRCDSGHGYNMTDGGEGCLGYIPSLETREKMAAAKLGKPRGPLSEDHRRKMSISALGNVNGKGGKGRVVSEETRRKLSESLKGRISLRKGTGKPKEPKPSRKGRPWSEARRAAEKYLGKSPSEETRLKMSLARKGKPLPPRTPEHNRKLALTKIGKKHSEESRRKMSASQKNRVIPQDVRDKISASLIRRNKERKIQS